LMARATAFGIHAEEVDGQDVRAVYAAAGRLVERARRGEGPAFLVCHTYRYRGHHVGDINRAYYRSKDEETQWMSERDPLQTLADWLTGEGLTDQGVLDRIGGDVHAEIEADAEFALNAPFPDVREVVQDIYA